MLPRLDALLCAFCRRLLDELPCEFVGTAEQLTSLVEFFCDQMATSYSEMGLHTPPWRTVKSMLALWQCSRPGSSSSPSSSSSSHARAAQPPAAARRATLRSSGMGHERFERQACRQLPIADSRARQEQPRQPSATLAAAMPAPAAKVPRSAAAAAPSQTPVVARVAWVRSPTAVAVGERIRACGNSAWGGRQ